MVASDLQSLLEMGFERERAEIALQKTSGFQDAIDWLEKHQESTLDDIQAENNADAEDGPALQAGEEARSLVCNDCGKKLRSTAQAEFHATKTQHADFSESTEEIKPLTEEEKNARLAELRTKLAEKRAGQSQEDKLDRKKNEEIRRKATKESQDIREDLQKKEQLKQAAQRKREKQEDIEARQRVQARIEADKVERRRKADLERAARAGEAPNLPSDSSVGLPTSTSTVTQNTSHTQSRLRLQTANGTLQKVFPAETTLFEVAHAIEHENGSSVSTFTTNFPKKTFDTTDFGMTLKEVGMVPSAMLIVG